MGAKKLDKIPKIVALNALFVTLTGVAIAAVALIFRYPLLSLYLDKASIIETAIDRLFVIAGSYFLCGLMDVLTGAIRGLGNSMVPMILTVVSVCGIRIVWVFTIFKLLRAKDFAHIILYMSYPASWMVAVLSMTVAVIIIYKKLKNNPLYIDCFENNKKVTTNEV